jgi:hypothetical protein
VSNVAGVFEAEVDAQSIDELVYSLEGEEFQEVMMDLQCC